MRALLHALLCFGMLAPAVQAGAEQFIRAEQDRWRALAKELDIQPQ